MRLVFACGVWRLRSILPCLDGTAKRALLQAICELKVVTFCGDGGSKHEQTIGELPPLLAGDALPELWEKYKAGQLDVAKRKPGSVGADIHGVIACRSRCCSSQEVR